MPSEIRTEFLQIVQDQAERLAHLVNDILEVSHLESNTAQFRSEFLSLRDLAERSLQEIRSEAQKKSQRLEVSYGADIPPFCGDAVRLQSIFSNLLSNSVKFTPEGGIVRLKLDIHQGEIRIAVCDTGLGIPANQIDQLFQRFFRVHRTGVTIGGTGLGLSIVKAIVEHYHGRIELESKEGHGSCFRVYLPLRTEREQEEADSPHLGYDI